MTEGLTGLVLIANAGDASVATFRLTADGLERLADSPMGGKCSTFAVDAARNLVYASIAGDNPGVAVFALNRESGQLEPLAHHPADPMAYLALTGDGTRLLGASYHLGYGTAWLTDDLARPTSRVDHPNVHSVAVTADGTFAYFVSLRADLVSCCRLDADGTLTEFDRAGAPAGSGPRHLVLDAAEENVYVLTEFRGEALHYRRDADGRLTFVGATSAHAGGTLRHSRFGADPRAEHLIWGADLHLSPNGTTLYCSERSESTIATLPVRPDGTLAPLTSLTAVEAQPRGFGVSTDGRLIVVGERSTTASLYVAGASGLERQAQVETGRGANWVRTVG